MIVRKVDNKWIVCNYNYLMIAPAEIGDDENAVKNYVHSILSKSKEAFVSNSNTDIIKSETMNDDFRYTSYSNLLGFVDMLTIGSVIDTVKVALWIGSIREPVMLNNSRYIENVIVEIDDEMVYVEIPEDSEGNSTYPILSFSMDYLELYDSPELIKMISDISKSVRDECRNKANDIRNHAGYKEFAKYLTDCDLTLLTDEGFGDLLR